MEKQAHGRKGALLRSHRSQGRTQTRTWTPGSVLSTLQGQLGQARRRGAEDISLNHRETFQSRRNKAAGGVPGAGALPSPSRGSGRAGMTQPGPMAVSGATFAGNLPAEAARTTQAPGKTAEPAAQADSMGAPCMGHSVRLESPPPQHPREPPPAFPTQKHPGPADEEYLGRQQEPPQQQRGQPGAGKSPKARERGRPRAGVQAQLLAEAKVSGWRHSQFTSPAPKAPFLSSNLEGLTHCVS